MSMEQMINMAVLVGLMSPFIIVGTGVVLGLTIAISNLMLGLVIGLMSIFGAEQEDE
jgi:hypothetical protein